MSHPIHWLYAQHIGPITTGDVQCYLCGISCPQEHAVVKGIADTFNSHYLARCPSSPYLCAPCQWYFDSKAKHPDFRKMSLIVFEHSWQNWPRADMKEQIEHWLTDGLPADAYLVVSLSKKKHILLQAPMNANGSHNLAVQTEEQIAHIYYDEWHYMDNRFMSLLQLGHNKGEILSGNLYGNTLRKHKQTAQAMVLSQDLAQWRNSPQIELLSYVTLVEDKADDTAITDSARDGDGTDSGNLAESRVDSDTDRLQIEVPHGHLVASREQRGSMRKDVEHIDEVLEPTLWEV